MKKVAPSRQESASLDSCGKFGGQGYSRIWSLEGDGNKLLWKVPEIEAMQKVTHWIDVSAPRQLLNEMKQNKLREEIFQNVEVGDFLFGIDLAGRGYIHEIIDVVKINIIDIYIKLKTFLIDGNLQRGKRITSLRWVPGEEMLVKKTEFIKLSATYKSKNSKEIVLCGMCFIRKQLAKIILILIP